MIMDALILAATDDTPGIIFDPQSDNFEINHRSLPENAIDFYNPIFEWINNYFSSTPGKFALNVKLEYFNTASAKQIAKLLLLLEKFNARTKVIVNWYYKPEDKDMLASGIRFSKLIPIEFNFIEF